MTRTFVSSIEMTPKKKKKWECHNLNNPSNSIRQPWGTFAAGDCYVYLDLGRYCDPIAKSFGKPRPSRSVGVYKHLTPLSGTHSNHPVLKPPTACSVENGASRIRRYCIVYHFAKFPDKVRHYHKRRWGQQYSRRARNQAPLQRVAEIFNEPF